MSFLPQVPAPLRIDYASPTLALIDHLAQAAVRWHQARGASAPQPATSIPLYMTEVGLWRSALGLALASRTQTNALQVSGELLSHLDPSIPAACRSSIYNPAKHQTHPTQLSWQPWVQSPGWIQVRLPPWALALCLQRLVQRPPRLAMPPDSFDDENKDPPQPFTGLNLAALPIAPLQYAHARCCALLQLGHTAGLISSPLHPEALDPALTWPQIPWLDTNQQLQFTHPAELELLRSLLQFPARLQRQHRYWPPLCPQHMRLPWPPPTAYLVKYLNTFAHQLDCFERTCTIFGVVQQAQPDLAIARLGLLLILQGVLAFVLQTLLGSEAPTDL